MFTGVAAKNFRSFEEFQFDAGRLNFVLGPNSSGKSSMLQILGIFIQTAEAAESPDWSELGPIIFNKDDPVILDATEIFSDWCHTGGKEAQALQLSVKFSALANIDQITQRARDILQDLVISCQYSLEATGLSGFEDISKEIVELQRTVRRSVGKDGAKNRVDKIKSSAVAILKFAESKRVSSQSRLLSERTSRIRSAAALNGRSRSAYFSGFTTSKKIQTKRSPEKSGLNNVFVSILLAIYEFAEMIHFIESAILARDEIRLVLDLEMTSNGKSSERSIVITRMSLFLGSVKMFEASMLDYQVQANVLWTEVSLETYKISNHEMEVPSLGRQGPLYDQEAKVDRIFVQIDTTEASKNIDLKRNIFRSVNQEAATQVDYRIAFALDLIDFCRTSLAKVKFLPVAPHRARPAPIYTSAEYGSKSDFMTNLIKKYTSKDVAARKRFVTALSDLTLPLGFGISLKKRLESIYSVEIADRQNDPIFHPLSGVGFGIAHLIPIMQTCALVVSLYSDEPCVVYIEQPEAHLHPKLHAEIADMLLRVTLQNEKAVIIVETHSDHLLNRLARRMRDGIKSKDGKALSNQDTKVFYVTKDRESGVSRLARLPHSESGDFALPFDFVEASLRSFSNDLPPL
ncbi:MAG: AAA family ATPase [Alphaproteobacteria bacterium]|nr:AAA family ATPase [Alphaproteobacteria bacterium]